MVEDTVFDDDVSMYEERLGEALVAAAAASPGEDAVDDQPVDDLYCHEEYKALFDDDNRKRGLNYYEYRVDFYLFF